MDTFVDSAWYFLRFTDPHNTQRIFDKDVASKWMPVHLYIGGVEHAILHLLYARFMTKFLHKEGLIVSAELDRLHGEPFKRLLTQGMVQGKTYKCAKTGRYLKPHQVDTTNTIPVMTNGGAITVSYEKMSKSKYNGVHPQDILNKYGADATRLFILFKAPPSEVLNWEEASIVGMERWLARIDVLVKQVSCELGLLQFTKSVDLDLIQAMNDTITKVTDALSTTFALNTAVSDLIKLTNALYKAHDASPVLVTHAVSVLVRLMAPFAPQHTRTWWERLSPGSGVHDQSWPTVLDVEITRTEKLCVVQVNGKTRFKVTVPINVFSSESTTLEYLMSLPQGNKWIQGHVRKVIIVKRGDLVNILL
jgi:leucyl-tRNA synthetase